MAKLVSLEIAPALICLSSKIEVTSWDLREIVKSSVRLKKALSSVSSPVRENWKTVLLVVKPVRKYVFEFSKVKVAPELTDTNLSKVKVASSILITFVFVPTPVPVTIAPALIWELAEERVIIYLLV